MDKELLERYRKYLTNAQVKELAAKAERYKLLNAHRRAEAQGSVLTQRRQMRRGLQNVGLAGREGKLISGMETARNDALTNAYDTYDRQLRKVEEAQVQTTAARMVNANIEAQRRATEEAYQRQVAEQARQQAAYNESLVDPRMTQVMTAPEKAALASAIKHPRTDPNMITDPRMQQQGDKRIAMQRAQKAAQKEMYRRGLDTDPRMQNATAPEKAEYAKIAPAVYQYRQAEQTIQQNSARWDAEINKTYSPRDSVGKGNRSKAIQEKSAAESQKYRAFAAMQYPQFTQYLLMPDDQFSVSYDAAKQQAARMRQQAMILRKDSAESMDDLSSEAAELERKAMELLAPWDQASALRKGTGEAPSLAGTINVSASDKTKDKQYGDMTQYVRENQENWKAVPWASKLQWNGDNWKTAREKGWSADDYAKKNGKSGSKYDALVNEWSFINGRTAVLYTQKFQNVQAVSNIGEFIGSIFGGDINRNAAYDWFRDECVMTYNNNPETSGTKVQKEQMDAMLTLANLMTDEERARFNGMLKTYGAKYADEYFEYLYNDVLPQRFLQYTQGEMAFDTRNPSDRLLQSIMSVPTNIVQGVTKPMQTLFSEQTDPVAARLSATKANTAQSMRGAVGQHYGKVGSFLYQTGMSMADSATVAMITGGIGEALAAAGVPTAAVIGGETVNVAQKAASVLGGSILGGSAFNSSYQEALDRGLTPEKARLTAFGNGVNEMLFESLSLDMVVSQFQKGGILKVSKNGFVNWFVNTMVQGGVEGSEEVFTDMANNLWDKKVNGIYSEELTKLREYISQGMSYADAKRKVNAEYAEQLGMSFLGGFASGGVMGGGASFLGVLRGHDVAKIGRNLDDAAKAEIREYDYKNAEAKEILTGKLTDEDYGRLAMTRLEEMAQTDPVAADKAAQSLIDAMARTDVKVDKRNQTLKTGTDNSVSFDYDGVTDVKKMSGLQVEALRFAQTLVKSKVGGVNIKVANKLFDQNGNEQNGWYDAKTNTVHVSLNGSQSVVYTISHELTHRLKSGSAEAYASLRDAMKSELESLDLTGSELPEEYENILGDYLVKDGVQRSAWEALIDYEMDRYAKHGITLDRESAEEEVVCRACETMLERSRLISSMISKNVRSAKTIAKFLASIYDDIASLKEEAESRGYADGSPEKLFIDQYTDVEKIANAWATAMRTVSQDTTKKIVKEEGRGGTAFSLKQELRDDGQSLADKSMKYRKAHKAESQHISDEMLEAANKQIHRMAQRMLPFLTLKNKKGMTYLPDEVLGKTRFGNSSYGGTSIENTTICFRTLAYIDFTNEIKKQIGRPLTVSESFLASQMLYQIAKEPQCLYCYVSLDRKAYDEQLLSYIKQRDKVVEGFNKLSLDERQAITKATRNPSKAFGVDIPLYTEFLAGRKDTPQMRTRFAQWIDIANSGSEAITAADLATDERRGLMRNGDDWQETKRTAGMVSLQDQVIDAERYAQSASWAKKMEEYRAYNGDILKIGKRTVNKLNNEYGLRFYSFSEYSPAFIVENMQQIRDAALKGLMGLAYTKKTDFARIFAGTGMNINVSTFGRWGVDADGNRVVVMDSDQGADWTEVQNLRKQYENVGAVFVATDDAMTEWAIKQDWIDVVIPFHIVRTGANVAEFYKWVVHNSEQNDVTAEGKNATIPAAEHGNSYEKYMSLVKERGLTPRFDKWRPENNPNVTADEYMKLVNETRRTLDATNPLQPIYDTREAARSFAAFVHDGGYYGDYYKAKSEQDIKVPVTPEQDILGIGSKTYTEQEGIDRVVSDIKAGNKANQVPYGRQDIDEQISRLNKARQVKQHGQKFSIKEGSKLSVTPMSNDVSSEMNTKFSIREEAAPTKTQDVYKLMRLGKDGRLYPLFIDSAEGIDVGVWYNADSPDMSDLKTLPSGVYLIGNDGKDIVTLADYQRTHGEKASKFPSKSAINAAATDGKRWVFIEDVAKGQRRYGGENRKYWNLGINGSGSVSTFAMRPGWHAGSLPTMRQIGKGANRNLRDDTFVWVKGRVSADVDYQAEASQNPDNDIPTHIPTNGFYMKATNPNATAAQTDTVGWYIAGAFIADKIMSDSEARNVIDDWNANHPSDHVEYDWERESGGEFDAETMSIRTGEDAWKNEDIRYSLKDTVEGESLGKDYLKYLQLGAKVVTQTATEAEIKEFKQRMVQLSEDNRMAFLDRLREKLIRADEAAKVREVRDRQIAALKEELKQARERRAADREARKRDDIKRNIQKGSAKITQMLVHPTEQRHVPVQLAQEVIEFMTMLNDFMNATVKEDAAEPMTKRGKAIAEKLKQVYDESFIDKDTIEKARKENPDYNPLDKISSAFKDVMLSDMITVVGDVLADKRVDTLTTDELTLINNVVRGVTRTILDANKLTQSKIKVDANEAGIKAIHEILSQKKMNPVLRTYLEETLDLRRLMLIFSGSNQDAVFVQLADELNQGAIEIERVAQVLQNVFKPVTDQYGKEIRKWYGKNAEWIDTGVKYKGKNIRMTKGMRVSLAMHVLNEGNMKHIKNGGLVIPDAALYKKGAKKDSYAGDGRQHVRLDVDTINEILKGMTEAEKAYLEVAKDFFHNRTGYYINRTSLATVGYRKAMVRNYFPIHTDDMFNIKDLAQYFMDNGGVETQGFLKERNSGGNPILLEDITDVINRQINGVSLYAGLAASVRNWNAVMNAQEWVKETETDNDGNEREVWRQSDSVERVLTSRMGENGVKVLKQFLADVQRTNHADVTFFDKFVNRIQRNYVQAVLLGNIKVAWKQLASIPTAAYVIPWKYLGQAMLPTNLAKKNWVDIDVLHDRAPLYAVRETGRATEITNLAREEGIDMKYPKLFGWMTMMDTWAVRRLWSAAEYMVRDQRKDIPVGSDEYYKAVNEIWQKTVQQTQPNFTPLQRADALRLTRGKYSALARPLVMFGTQRMQNGGILIEATAELINSKGKSKDVQREARLKFGRAVASQVVQNVMLILISGLSDYVRGRMRALQDDDDEITDESVSRYIIDQFLSNGFGSFLGGSEVYEILIKKWVANSSYDKEFSVPFIDALETIAQFADKQLPDALKYFMSGERTDEEKLKKAKSFGMQMAKVFGYATGIPVENLVKDILNGAIPRAKDHIAWRKTGELIPFLHQSGKLDSATTAANYKEWTNLGKKGSVYLYWEKKLNDTDGGLGADADELFKDQTLTPEEKAMLLRMIDWASNAQYTNKGGIVYKQNGEIAVDFTNLDRYRASQNLTEMQMQGVQDLISGGIAEDVATTAFIKYSELHKQGSGYNDRFNEWLNTVIKDPEERAYIRMGVIGSKTTVNQYEYGKKLVASGLSKEKAYELVDTFVSVKKKEAEPYLKGLTEEQIKLIYEFKGWKYE